MNTSRFTSFSAAPCSTYWVWEDEFWKGNTWYYMGKKHWACVGGYFVRVPSRHWIEWTPNVICSRAKITGGEAKVTLASFTPNFRTYQIKSGDGRWTDCKDEVSLTLERKLNRFSFRTVNLFGVTGPVHRVEIEWEER